MSNRRSTLTRDHILLEACRLVSRDGVSNLTLEKVAKEAGVSKGGLLYHFPSKETLIKGMIDDMLKRSYQDIDYYLSKENDEPGKWLRAFIQTTFKEVGRKDLISPGLMSMLLANTELLDSWRKTYADWTENIENDNQDLLIASIVRLACEGLWFTDLLGFSPVQGEFRQQILNTLVELTKKDHL
ncbi:TetR/AcrR family transcriptional regulator [Peribacillus glennii]|uniref:TetR/AcrR family transcriptional regulator n=1 Tax=Peribacillus glennii TaxID=2303991 RepID=A0A372LJH1_9BACI|nr:TetR/AcrR family transcriptional regulator [Peribacillus glennii]RFU66610.1 TetR/AcrR family transcriptional regulator [Peribacillus glennii]